MKADKKKAKAEADETKPKSKSGSKGKDKRKASDVPSGKKKAKKSTPDTEVKLLPEPKAKTADKTTANFSGGTKAAARPTAGGSERAVARQAAPLSTEDAPRATGKAGAKSSTQAQLKATSKTATHTKTGTVAKDSTQESARVSARGSTPTGGQGQATVDQATPKAKSRPTGSAVQGSRVAAKSSAKVHQQVAGGGEATGVTGSQARAQDKERLRVKSASAARARKAYTQSDEQPYWEEEEEDEEEEIAQESDVKERGLVQFRRAHKPDEPVKKEPMVKKSTLIIGAVCVAVLFVGFCMVNFAPKQGGFPGGPGGPGFGGEATQVTVRSTTAQVATLHDYVETNGEIECESSVECYPDIGGKIAKVFVALGDRVWKGTALAEVDPNEPGTYFINSVVYAPISGMVTATPKEVGTTVTTTTSITTIGNVTRLQIRAKVPERYVAFLKVGLKANIILEAYPDETFTATVRKVSPIVDSDSRTKEILLRFDQSDPRINAGMFAKITLFTADYEGEIVVPSNAIVEKTGGKQNVFVLAPGGGSVSLREVETGKSVDTMVQILSGLNEGERVITEGMTSLSDGAAVRDITVGLGQSALFAESASAFQAGSEPQGGSAAGGSPPSGAPGGRGATR